MTTTAKHGNSPRTEQRMLAKQQRSQMGMAGNTQAKFWSNGPSSNVMSSPDAMSLLHDRNVEQTIPPCSNKHKQPCSNSPTSQGLEDHPSNDHPNFSRIEQILGPHSQFSAATSDNMHKFTGVSNILPSTPLPVRKDHKDKRKIQHKPQDPLNNDPLKTKNKSSESGKNSDLRHKLNHNKRKSCPGVPSGKDKNVSHKDLKERVNSQRKAEEVKRRSKKESLIEFTPLPGVRKRGDSEGEPPEHHDNKDKDNTKNNSKDNKELERSEKPDPDVRRSSSNERRKSKELRRQEEKSRREAEERKKKHKSEQFASKSDSDIDSDCSSSSITRQAPVTPTDITKLSLIFELMMPGMMMSPLHSTEPNLKPTFPSPIRSAETDVDEEDEFDISKLSMKLKQEGLVHVPTVESESDDETFPLSKSHMSLLQAAEDEPEDPASSVAKREDPIVEESKPVIRDEARVAKEREEMRREKEREEFKRHAKEKEELRLSREKEELRQKEEIRRSKEREESRRSKEREDSRRSKEREDSRRSKEREEFRRSKEKEELRRLKEKEILQRSKEKAESRLKESVIEKEESRRSRDREAPCHSKDVRTECKEDVRRECKEVKPIIAVNPTIKERLKSKGDPSLYDNLKLDTVLKMIHDGSYSESSIDFSKLLQKTSNSNMVMRIGYQKLSSKFIKDPSVLKALTQAKRKQRSDSECSEDISSDDLTKPREKPSCIVPGVPRTEASVKCLAKPEPRTPATAAREVSPLARSPRRHSPRRGSTSPRSNSDHSHPDANYHRDPAHSREWIDLRRKRRRVTHEAEYEQYPPPPHPYPHPHHYGLPAIPPYAYLQLQPALPQHDLLMRGLVPAATRPTFLSEAEDTKHRTEVELSLKKHLLSSDDYITKARSLKREADPMEANVEKIKKYLSAVIQYVYASLSMCQRSEITQAYTLLHSTLTLLDHLLSPRARRGLDVKLQNKRLAALCLMMVSAIQRHMWVMKRQDCKTLQEKCSGFVRQLKGKKEEPALPRNLNSSSPTPSPAGSVASIASYTGTECIDSGSVSPLTEVISHDMLRNTNNYFKLATHLYEWTESWEEAGKHALKESSYFTHLDEQCGSLRPSSHLYSVARYIDQGVVQLNYQL